jgi:hypothetical protein
MTNSSPLSLDPTFSLPLHSGWRRLLRPRSQLLRRSFALALTGSFRDRVDRGNVASVRVLEKRGLKCDGSATYFGRERHLYVDEEGNSAVATDNDARGAAAAGAS